VLGIPRLVISDLKAQKLVNSQQPAGVACPDAHAAAVARLLVGVGNPITQSLQAIGSRDGVAANEPGHREIAGRELLCDLRQLRADSGQASNVLAILHGDFDRPAILIQIKVIVSRRLSKARRLGARRLVLRMAVRSNRRRRDDTESN
jgi:hypothetical protein